jgi:hypothetical protein
MNKLTLQKILFARYKGVTIKTTFKTVAYYHNGKLVGIYDPIKQTGVILTCV